MAFPSVYKTNLAEILFFLWLAFRRNGLQKHNGKSIPWGIAEKIVQKLKI